MAKRNTKKTILQSLVVSILIIASMYIFRFEIASFLLRFKYKSPVEWNQIRVKFPEGMIYRIDEKHIEFLSLRHPKEYISIRKFENLTPTGVNLTKTLRNNEFDILNTKQSRFMNYKSFEITSINNKSKTYGKWICIVPKDICVAYLGEKSSYKYFNEVINGIEFLDN